MRFLIAALLLTTAAQAAPLDVWQRKYMLASRNSGGTYSLPNPAVVTGSSISSTWANSTLNDLATEITNSLDRSGRGAMTGPLRLKSGASPAAPDLAWDVETNSGWYRAAAGDFRFSFAGVDGVKWTSAVQQFPGTLKINTAGTTPVVFDNAPFSVLTGLWFGAAAADGVRAVGNYSFLAGDGLGTYMNAATGQTGHLRINNADVISWTGSVVNVAQPSAFASTVSTGTLTVGSGGTGISKSIRGTLAVGGGNILTQACVDQSVTVTGAVAGAECSSGYTTALPNGTVTGCSVTATNVCVVTTCNPTITTVTAPANTLSCRVWNP